MTSGSSRVMGRSFFSYSCPRRSCWFIAWKTRKSVCPPGKFTWLMPGTVWPILTPPLGLLNGWESPRFDEDHWHPYQAMYWIMKMIEDRWTHQHQQDHLILQKLTKDVRHGNGPENATDVTAVFNWWVVIMVSKSRWNRDAFWILGWWLDQLVTASFWDVKVFTVGSRIGVIPLKFPILQHWLSVLHQPYKPYHC